MRSMMILVAVAFLIPPPARCSAADLDPQILLELARAKRLRESKTVAPAIPTKTLCGCGPNVACGCFESTCGCPACGRGGAAKQPGKRPSASTPTIPAQSVTTPHPRAQEPGLSEGTLQGDTSIPVPTAKTQMELHTPGSTSGGCASGNCPSSTQRGFFGRRR